MIFSSLMNLDQKPAEYQEANYQQLILQMSWARRGKALKSSNFIILFPLV